MKVASDEKLLESSYLVQQTVLVRLAVDRHRHFLQMNNERQELVVRPVRKMLQMRKESCKHNYMYMWYFVLVNACSDY